MKIKVAAIQFSAKAADAAANRRIAAPLLEQAADMGARLLVLPELWNTGYGLELLPEIGSHAEDMRGPTVTMLREFAARRQVVVVGGSIAERKGDRLYNTSVLIGRDGGIIAKYRKVHLFTQYQQEHLYFSAGEEWVVEDVDLGGATLRLGMSTCYDLRFPEFYRNMALRGARLLTVPSAWPQARVSEFELLCRARADENRCWLVAANQTGGVYSGSSLIASPLGQALALAQPEDNVIIAELDTEIWSRRECFLSLNDRRQFLDEIDDNLL